MYVQYLFIVLNLGLVDSLNRLFDSCQVDRGSKETHICFTSSSSFFFLFFCCSLSVFFLKNVMINHPISNHAPQFTKGVHYSFAVMGLKLYFEGKLWLYPMLQFKCSLNTVTVKRDMAKWFAQLKIEKQHDL